MKKRLLIISSIILIIIVATICILINFKHKKDTEYHIRLGKLEDKYQIDITEILNQIENDTVDIKIYFKTDTDSKTIDNIQKQINNMKYVRKTELISKEQALEIMKETFEDAEWIFDGYEGESNIFPNSLIITINGIKNANTVENELSTIQEIDTIKSSADKLNNIKEEINNIKEDVYGWIIYFIK